MPTTVTDKQTYTETEMHMAIGEIWKICLKIANV